MKVKKEKVGEDCLAGDFNDGDHILARRYVVTSEAVKLRLMIAIRLSTVGRTLVLGR